MNTNLKLIPLIIGTLFFCKFLTAQEFRAGASFRKITPERLLPISGGMGEPTMPVAFKGDLFARAIVFEKGTVRVAIVSVDNLGWPSYLGDQSRKLVKGIAPENILIGATHTHSAPDAYGFADEKGNTAADLNYLEWCVRQIADAVNEAVARLEPVALKTNVGIAKGKIAYNYYADKLYDQRCGVIQAISSTGSNKGKPLFTLVNYAIHPEILGTDRRLLSPDLCGPLYDRIEGKGGGMAIFMNSAQGGMVTADNRLGEGKEANDWNECVRIGELLADEALRIVENTKENTNPGLACRFSNVKLQVDNQVMQEVFKNSPVAKKYKKQDDFTAVTTQMNLVDIGEARILTIPGEALPNIGFYLKRKMKSDQPFIFGLTNDAFGYILAKEDFQSFERYNYISRTSLGELTGETIENEALKLIDKAQSAKK